MKLLFLGSPGVGKGTYAQVIKEALEIPHISTGDLLRDEAQKATDMGEEIKQTMVKGELVSDDVLLKLIEARIKNQDCDKGFILDGFPRTENQARDLDNLVEITHVLNFKADDEVIIERFSGRIICGKCKAIFHKNMKKPIKEGICDECGFPLHRREDDKPDLIKKRLDVYRKKTEPLIEYYDKKGLLIEVIINKPINEVRDKVEMKIMDYLEGKIDKIGEIR